MSVAGHSTKTALTLLVTELEVLLAVSRTRQNRAWIREALHPNSVRSLFRFTTVLCGLILSLCLVLHGEPGHIVSGSLLIVLVVGNVLVSGWEAWQRSREILKRTQKVLLEVKETIALASWQPENYPHLHTPMSASVVLQWTLRDGKVVNLPWTLLVKSVLGNNFYFIFQYTCNFTSA